MYAKPGLMQRGGKTKPNVSLAKLWKSNGPFMLQTFALLIAQLLVTFIIMFQLGKSEKFAQIIDKNKIAFGIGLFVITLGLIIVLTFVPMPIYLKIALFTLFSVVLGLMLAYTKRFVPPAIIRTALIGAISIFVVMFIVGLGITLLGFDLSWMYGILIVALMMAIISGIVMLFIDVSQKALRIRAALIIFLFMLFILYDTNQILQRDYYGDIATAAMDYYLDVINIFINMITALSSGD